METVTNKGRYIMYSIEVDDFLRRNHSFIESFKSEKVSELTSYDYPYRLDIKEGRALAITAIKDEMSKRISEFSEKHFQQPIYDIAFSIVAKVALKNK